MSGNFKVKFIYPSFERHANSHPELLKYVPCDEYLGSPSLGIACLSAVTPEGVDVSFVDDRVTRFDPDTEEADLFAISSFTPGATRAMEIGKALVQNGKKVVFGGIFPTHMPDEAAKACSSVVVGEGEPVWSAIIADAKAGSLKPRYQASVPFDLSSAGTPDISLYTDAEKPGFAIDDYPLQPSRGCPLRCSACAIPGVMGSKFRFYDTEVNIRAALELYSRRKRFCITEDTLFLPVNRSKMKVFLTELYKRSGHPLLISYIGISMPMILNLDDELLKLLVQIGVNRFYLVCGFDSITQKGFGTGDAEALEKCRQAIQRCHEFNIIPYISLLVGTEMDDEGVFDRMLEFATQTKIPTAEFAVSTPYPGTPFWHQCVKEDRLLTREWNKYNDANVVFRPKNMSPERLQEGYLYLWKEFYSTRQHLKSAGHDLATVQF